MTDTLPTLAIIGGTGKEGAGLALRWLTAGYPVIIGSRDAARAAEKAAELNTQTGTTLASGMENIAAAAAGQIVVLSVPYESHAAILTALKDALQGKILIDVTVPARPPNVHMVHIPEGKSACVEGQTLLGAGVKVVAAFQNVSAVHLKKGADHPIACDVLVCGDDEAAKTQVIALVKAVGLRGIDAGPLVNATAAEALTSVLVYINKRYTVKGAGIQITGLEGL
jgi:NADPH-dependent F420 reductase